MTDTDTAELSPITLLVPAEGAETPPLQKHHWPTDRELQRQLRERDGDDALAWQHLHRSSRDRSLPNPVTFAWEPPLCPPSRHLRYCLKLATSRTFESARVYGGLRTCSVEIANLCVATTYFWQVEASKRERVVAQSSVQSFRTNPALPRWLNIPGMTNVRDLGGWPLPGGKTVRQGQLFRGSEMNVHLHVTEDGRRILLDELGLRTDLDLRGLSERAMPALDQDRVQWINVPVWPYEGIIDARFAEGYRRIFNVLSHPANYPLLFHCWGGADRAGTVAFLVLGLLGVSQEDLIRDYELTTLSVWGERSRRSGEFRNLLDALARFGDGNDSINVRIENYIRGIGITENQVEAIRKHLTVDCA